MSNIFIYLSSHLLHAALAALLCATVFQSSSAASCGDWLASSSKTHGPATVVDQKPAKASLRDHREPFGQRPCRGPACRGAPTVPLSPVPDRAVDPPLEQWALIDDSKSQVADGWEDVQRDDSRRARRGFPLPVERPPRV